VGATGEEVGATGAGVRPVVIQLISATLERRSGPWSYVAQTCTVEDPAGRNIVTADQDGTVTGQTILNQFTLYVLSG